MPDLLTAFALGAAVLMVAALTSGIVERAPISAPMIFLGLGFLLGERGLGLLQIGPHSPALEAIAVVTLVFALAGGFFLWRNAALAHESPEPFSATLAELAKDRTWLTGGSEHRSGE